MVKDLLPKRTLFYLKVNSGLSEWLPWHYLQTSGHSQPIHFTHFLSKVETTVIPLELLCQVAETVCYVLRCCTLGRNHISFILLFQFWHALKDCLEVRLQLSVAWLVSKLDNWNQRERWCDYAIVYIHMKKNLLLPETCKIHNLYYRYYSVNPDIATVTWSVQLAITRSVVFSYRKPWSTSILSSNRLFSHRDIP